MGDTKRPVMKENPIRSLPGIPVLLGVLVVAAGAAWLFFHGVGATGGEPAAMQVIASAVLVAVAVFCLVGLYKVEPNQAAVLSLFGKYVGTVKDNGLRWNNPFFAKRKVSMRVRNFESGRLKRSEEHTSELQSLMRISYAVFCL